MSTPCRATIRPGCLIGAMDKVKGDTGATKALISAMEATKFDSPRGPWHFSRSHNPVQDIYMREVRNGDNAVIGIAEKAVNDPGTGCGLV